ncbi:hypothetical protein C8Q77DRAFT_565243 [Trametes polyzona]|nr:hypothetical protein C8Q77DRAFT_565243 [Trametes polyzona]
MMYAKIFAAFLLPLLAVSAHPAKRADSAVPSASAAAYQSQAKELLDAVNSEISAAGPSASAYTAYIRTVQGRPVVEMAESVSGQVWVAMTSGEPAPTATAQPVVDAAADASSAASSSSAADSNSGSASATMSGTQSASPTGSKNAAAGLSVSKPLLTGVVGALGAVGAGALMLL